MRLSWRPGSGSSRLGATPTRADTSSLTSPAILRPIHRPNAALQTADIARHLMRGGELHQEEGASSWRDPIAIFRAFSSISLPFVSSIQAL